MRRTRDVECECPRTALTAGGVPDHPLQKGIEMPKGIYARETRPAIERFWERVDRNGPVPEYAPHLGRCWLWTGALNVPVPLGYGQFSADRRSRRAHRWSYEHFVGPIPEGLEIDHLCRVRHCVNPSHLEPVTRSENMQRAPLRGRQRHALTHTHCPYGHPYDEANTMRMPRRSGRRCRACYLADGARYRARRKARG